MHSSAQLELPKQMAWQRRCFDLAIAATALVLLSPLMMLVALAIFVSGGRPIFYSQARLGQTGRHFYIYKFRKFYKDNGAAGLPLTMKNDSRLTRIGAFLQRTKLDELPQLWNVLKGEMSIVGPRPESIKFADCYTDTQLKVLDYKPGIFGPSQVVTRDECTFYPENGDPVQFYRDVLFPMKTRIDLSYYPDRTLFSDIGWIMRGVLAVIGWQSHTRLDV
jgi:lipopolysaccharide/colanic/teichoic acid biosynthesis glycosyltransferase